MPDTATLDYLLRLCADRTPDQSAAYHFWADGRIEADHATWGELDRRAWTVAAALQGAGAPGDHALLLYPLRLGSITAFLGCLCASVVAVPGYPRLPLRLTTPACDQRGRFSSLGVHRLVRRLARRLIAAEEAGRIQ